MKPQITSKNWETGWQIASHNHLLSRVSYRFSLLNFNDIKDESIPRKMIHVRIKGNSHVDIIISQTNKIDPNQWAFLFSTIFIFFAFDSHLKYRKTKKWTTKHALLLFSMYYVTEVIKNDHIPSFLSNYNYFNGQFGFRNEDSLAEQLEYAEESYPKLKTITFSNNFLEDWINFEEVESFQKNDPNFKFSDLFAQSLVEAAQQTINLKAGLSIDEEERKKRNTKSARAKRWLMTNYPLFASVVAPFEVVENLDLCRRLKINIAAISIEEKTIFFNPLANLSEEELKFVIAHEALHAGLAHHSRCQSRDPYIWNLACDFVINDWLVQMGIGRAPANVYLDQELSGKSAEEIYLLICKNVRLQNKLLTLRGQDCDMLDPNKNYAYYGKFEDACKDALMRGVFLHDSIGKGFLPGDLVEEIKAINQPPIPWQVELADWFAQQFPLEEKKRNYSRPSRRQSSTPDIIRPKYVTPTDEHSTRTFGVIIDTSGSMNIKLLGKCLGAITSYANANEVKFVRLICCDVVPYDEGFVQIEMLAQKYKMRGRGGTIIQKAVDYLEIQKDFPQTAPILILTDGYIEDDLSIGRTHAFLLPDKNNLPFIPKGKVFEFK
jgi:predicted metal-dependent peptidase